MLTAGQPGRRSRLWWRNVLDQFGASDVVIPVARLERQWPGGPVRGTFTARYGPDNTYLDSFTLTANDDAGVPAMLNQALVRLDRIYSDALSQGLLKPDPTLSAEQNSIDAALAAIVAAYQPKAEAAKASTGASTDGASDKPSDAATEATVGTYTVQFASPDAAAIDAALSAVRGAAGVQGASTSSIAIGGTSVMRVTYAGQLDALAAALRARGWTVFGRRQLDQHQAIGPGMSQIALPLGSAAGHGPSRIVVGNANAAAIAALSDTGNWPFRTAVLTGPPRSGKTLLAGWFADEGKGEAIDDANRMDETALFHAWNRAQESGTPLLLTVGGEWHIALPDLASRIGAAAASGAGGTR